MKSCQSFREDFLRGCELFDIIFNSSIFFGRTPFYGHIFFLATFFRGLYESVQFLTDSRSWFSGDRKLTLPVLSLDSERNQRVRTAIEEIICLISLS